MIVPVLPIEFYMIQPVMHLFLAHLATTSLNAMFAPLCYFFLASPLHVAPACVGSGEGSPTLGLMYAAFPYISVRDCFQDLNP
jgi:hypothetical protein